MDSEELFRWMEEHGVKTSEMAERLGVDSKSLSVYKSRGLPKKKEALAQRVINEWFEDPSPRITRINVIEVTPSPSQRRQWEQNGLVKNGEFTDFAIDRLDHLAQSIAEASTYTPPTTKELSTPQNIHTLPYYGAVAAGEPVATQLDSETINVLKEYPAGYFVVEVNGQSMEPTLEDGSKIICEPKEYSPKHNKICIISDGHGSSVKRFDKTKKAYTSDNPAYNDFTPMGEVKLQGYFVEILPIA